MTVMNSPLFKSKIKAALLHGVISLIVAFMAYLLIFHVWFQGELSEYLGGTKLFFLLVGIELSLGPLISLVIFDPEKDKRKMVMDYVVVGSIQLAALLYGVYSIALSRPVMYVLVKDRFEIILDKEISNQELAISSVEHFKQKPWWQPRVLCVEFPKNTEENLTIAMEAMHGGRDIQLRPQYYKECNYDEITSASSDKRLLAELVEDKGIDFDLTPYENIDYKWIPVSNAYRGFATVLLLPKQGKKEYEFKVINIDLL